MHYSENCKRIGCPSPVAVALLFFCGCADDPYNGLETDSEALETDSEVDTSDACLFPPFADCSTTLPAPGEEDAVLDFIARNAIPFECENGGELRLNIEFVADRFAGNRLLMLGEVHGSQQIGRTSASIAAYLAENGMIDAVAIEIPMDVTDAMREYVETGSLEKLNAYGYEYWSPDLFWRTLPEIARKLHDSGMEIEVSGIDFPWKLAWVNSELKRMASQMSPEASAIVLEGMPPDKEFGEKVDRGYVTNVLSYRKKLEQNQGVLCADLTEIECTQLLSLARGYQLGAQNSFPEFWDSGPAQIAAFFDERELLLRDNISVKFQNGAGNMFAHMGTMHVIKSAPYTAGYLNRDDPNLAGLVYSINAAYGPGSEVLFHGELQKLAAEPAVVGEALSDTEWSTYLLLVNHPGIDCHENPLASRISQVTDELYSVFDALLWFRALSPESDTKKSRSGCRGLKEIVTERWQRTIYLNDRSNKRLVELSRRGPS